MNAFVIVNPISGSVKDLDAVMKQLDRLGTDAIHLTRKAGDAQALARKAVRNKYDYLIAAGGDGTLNEMINGIATHARDIRVGLLPLGTGNDFARSLRLPATIEENIDVLLAGKTRAIDLVKVRSDRVRYFVNVSAGGFSGLVDEKLTPEIKRTWGPLAYVRSAAAALPELRAYRTDIELDNDEKLSVDLYNIIVANGIFVAGGLPVAPEADPCDGLLDIIIIPKRSAPEIALLAAQIVLGNHLGSEAITFRRSSRVSVNSQPGMWFNVDGELVGNEPAVFEIIPRALKFVVGTT
ncbi:MAG: diacylglycerol kinase [Verrucomicrobiota bacterium]